MCFKVLIPDNLKPVVANADPINPTFTVGWLDYAHARGGPIDADDADRDPSQPG